jgi:EAL domain-containing protein (putative c-di-GMP-specific phosphodiesterase class I)/CheY-like chemotaxis protein
MSRHGRGPRILVVDDDPFALKVLSRQLERLGCESVAVCERALDALALVEAPEAGVDLIFCDLDMPEMDGIELVRNLVRASYSGALVLVSGEGQRVLHAAESLARAHGLRILGARSKPVALGDLRDLLEREMIREPQLAPATRQSYRPHEVRHAIDAGELVCEYQPLVEARSGALIGAETLVRWRHPTGTTIYPDQFVGVAEEHGLIDGLTERVLTLAVRQGRIWRDQGLDLRLSVNVSMDNLVALDFPDIVAGKAVEAGFPVSSLVLEVTESRLMKDPVAVLDILTRLRLKGIGLSIDDFGTGHSSLAQLHDLPFNQLKIDRRFVRGASRDGASRAIFVASFRMSEQLCMDTVAEGVEDADDWRFLRSVGCGLAQGYFIGRPMPPEALPAWLESWEARRPELTRA